MSLPTSPRIKGDQNVFWGTNGIYSARVVSGGKKPSGDVVEVADNDGFTTTRIYFNFNEETSFKMVAPSAIPEFNKGDLITVLGVVCEIQEAETNWEQKGVAMISITAKRWAKG
jgi:hypothetical protein